MRVGHHLLVLQVAVERPDKIGRDQILRVHLQRRGLPLAEDVTVENLASATTGFTGADLANLVNEVFSCGPPVFSPFPLSDVNVLPLKYA